MSDRPGQQPAENTEPTESAEPAQTDPVPDAGPGGVGLLRTGLGAVGVAVGVYGAWLILSRQDLDQLVSAALWLGGGVVVHDGLIALASLGAVAAGALLLPTAARAPAAVGLVVLGSVTLMAIPVLGSFNDEENSTLLNRSYWAGWGGIVALVLVAVVVASVVRARRGAGTDRAVAAHTSHDSHVGDEQH